MKDHESANYSQRFELKLDLERINKETDEAKRVQAEEFERLCSKLEKERVESFTKILTNSNEHSKIQEERLRLLCAKVEIEQKKKMEKLYDHLIAFYDDMEKQRKALFRYINSSFKK